MWAKRFALRTVYTLCNQLTNHGDKTRVMANGAGAGHG